MLEDTEEPWQSSQESLTSFSVFSDWLYGEACDDGNADADGDLPRAGAWLVCGTPFLVQPCPWPEFFAAVLLVGILFNGTTTVEPILSNTVFTTAGVYIT